jgi:hypothetical protein
MGLPRSARPIPEDAKQPAYSAGSIKHLSSKFARRSGEASCRSNLTQQGGAFFARRFLSSKQGVDILTRFVSGKPAFSVEEISPREKIVKSDFL